MTQALEFEWVETEEQFAVGRGSVRTTEGHINFAVKQPREMTDYHPMVTVPGFTDGLTGLDRLTNAYAEMGRFAVSLEHPRVDHPEYKDDPEGHKSDNIKVVFEAVGELFPDLEEADLQGHSDGGSNASRFALEHPEAVRTLVVLASGGLIENDSQAKIMRRAVTNPDIISDWGRRIITHPGLSLRLIASSVGFIRRHPRKAVEEAAYIASADIRPRFLVLSRFKHIPNGAIQFQRDVLFPLHMVDDSTNKGAIFDEYEVYPDATAGHLAPHDHPRKVGGEVIRMVEKLLATADAEVVN